MHQIRAEEEAKADELMEEDRRRGIHMDAKETYLRKAAALEAQEQLEEQILEREHQKELAYQVWLLEVVMCERIGVSQAYLEEKAKVDGLVQKMDQEDRAEMEADAQKKVPVVCAAHSNLD